ncbi:MAG: extracellular solute-binding protein [Anaerolineales bacterium]|nr:extracellular solute-binding protein [Anaerolineales bacterium]
MTIRWFIGLHTGNEPERLENLRAFVERFNRDQQGKFVLVPEIYTNAVAAEVLQSEIASGDPPDIVGPMGVDRLWGMENAWLDLDPLVAETGYDLSDFHPALIDTLRSPGRGLEALPIVEFPSALFYNKALFDAAGIPYPPHSWESDYQGKPWTFDALRRIGMQMTLDASGRNAADPGFNPAETVQWGYYSQWPNDIRGQWIFLGAASMVGGDGSAVIPDIWRRAAEWHYRGMWNDHFLPTGTENTSLDNLYGAHLASGMVAMVPQNTWLT